MNRRWSFLKRPTAEFVAIFAGVTLSFLADDWREQRADRELETAGLQLILTDLEADSASLQTAIHYLGRNDRAAATFLGFGEDAPPPDVLSATLLELIYGTVYQFRRSGFLSLRDAGHLALIRNTELRADITTYFEEGQLDVDQWISEHLERMLTLSDRMAPHIRYPRPRDSDSAWPLSGPLVVTSTWPELRADQLLDQWLIMTGATAAIGLGRAEDLLDSNRDLQAAIREELRAEE